MLATAPWVPSLGALYTALAQIRQERAAPGGGARDGSVRGRGAAAGTPRSAGATRGANDAEQS